MPIEFGPKDIQRLLVLNPGLKDLLDPEPEETVSEEELIETYRDLEVAWHRLSAAYEASIRATESLERARRGRPLATPVQLLGAFIFMLILVRIIG